MPRKTWKSKTFRQKKRVAVQPLCRGLVKNLELSSDTAVPDQNWMLYHIGPPEALFSVVESSDGFADYSVRTTMNSQLFQRPRGTTPLSVAGLWMPSSPSNSHFVLQQPTFPSCVISLAQRLATAIVAEVLPKQKKQDFGLFLELIELHQLFSIYACSHFMQRDW